MNLLLKFTGALLLVLSTTACGFFLSSRLKLRRDFLISFIDFLSTLETGIRYSNDDIITLVKKSMPDSMSDIFKGSSGNDFRGFWDNSILQIPKIYGLNKEDYSLLNEFGRHLGTTDTQGQINHISLYKSLFESQLTKSENDYKNKSKLYKLLGFFSGSMLALMFI